MFGWLPSNRQYAGFDSKFHHPNPVQNLPNSAIWRHWHLLKRAACLGRQFVIAIDLVAVLRRENWQAQCKVSLSEAGR
jgi:hypothetical protein